MDRFTKPVITGIVVTVLMLGILLSGQKVYQKYYVSEPLLAAYQQIKAVKNVRVQDQDQNDGDKILVTIDPKANLKQVYQLVDAQTRKLYGNKEFTIELSDQPSASLENNLTEIEPYIYQGLATGQLVEMVSGVKEKSALAGIDARIYLDNQRVYLVLQKGNKYLQEIIPREVPVEVPVSGGAKV